jgi:predicted phosphodiesterase
MRLAVISDIHGNAVALETVLADLREVAPDGVVCLGDVIQGGPQPAEVTGILRNSGWPIVMGNADAWLLSGVETSDELADEDRARQLYDVRAWSLTKLSEEDKAYIAGFVPTITIDLTKNAEVLCFHGSPNDFDKVLLPLTSDEEFAEHLFDPFEQRIFTGGHTHTQFIRHNERRFFFNPGSVGAAYYRGPGGEFRAEPWAEYAVLTVTDKSSSLEFRRVAFDVEKLLSVYKASGRPYLEAALKQYSG